jgi:hypothetical protein
MKSLFHSIAALSIGLAAGIGAAALAAPAATSIHYGRWTIHEDNPTFTARGRLYKTIDIAPCGNDFCGVSVNDAGSCGPVLFRFFARNANANWLQGHALWGKARKNIQIENAEAEDWPGKRWVEIYIGDGYDFGGRSESMPKFHGEYKRIGEARCKAR